MCLSASGIILSVNRRCTKLVTLKTKLMFVFVLVLSLNSVNLRPSPMCGTVFRWLKMRFLREIR